MALILRQPILQLKKLLCCNSMIPNKTLFNGMNSKPNMFKMVATFSAKCGTQKNRLLRSNSSIRNWLNCNTSQRLMFENCVRSLTTLTRHLDNKTMNLLKNSCLDGNIIRLMSGKNQQQQNTTAVLYICATLIFMLGMAYAGVPLYRMFCQATGFGGQPTKGHDTGKVETMEPVREKAIKICFNADTASSMQWNFHPQQPQITVVPGETALAFYTAQNPTDKPVIGISTYNVLPFEAGVYFNKIQCFCFEEQRLNPHEKVDMPVFFYIDPEFAEDPKMEFVDTIILSYTFFEAKDGMNLPLPGFMRATQTQ